MRKDLDTPTPPPPSPGSRPRATRRSRPASPAMACRPRRRSGCRWRRLRATRRRSAATTIWRVALWKTGWTDARMLAALVGEPARVTPAEMDAWCRDFDSWGIVDTVCFTLWDRSPHAWPKAEAMGEAEAGVREARRLRADGVPRRARQDRRQDAAFLPFLPLIEKGASRRAELREEGRELGAAPHRSSQRQAACRRDQDGDAPGEVGGPHRAMGGEGRA